MPALCRPTHTVDTAMIKRHVMIIISVSSIIGIITGMATASAYWLQFGDVFAKMAAAARTEAAILNKVALLEHLRSGRVKDATTQLESQLDSDLIGAGSLARNGVELSVNLQRAVETERRARGVTGYEPSNPRLSEQVEEAFRLVSHPYLARELSAAEIIPPESTH